MKIEYSSQKWGGGGLLTPIMASPFALQSIFLALCISEHPPFTGNSSFPGDFHGPAKGGKVETKKRHPKVVCPIRS